MAPTKKDPLSIDNLGDLTGHDIQRLLIAWNCLQDKSIDINLFATAAGYANTASGRVCWNITRRKVEKYFRALDIIQTTDAADSGAPTNRGQQAKRGNAADNNDQCGTSPKKRKTADKNPTTALKMTKDVTKAGTGENGEVINNTAANKNQYAYGYEDTGEESPSQQVMECQDQAIHGFDQSAGQSGFNH